MIDQLRANLERIPFTALLIALFGYLGYHLHDFKTNAGSPLQAKQESLSQVRQGIERFRVRVREVEEFRKSLDTKRVELRNLAQDLENAKAILSEDQDVPGFMKMVIEEAQRSGLAVNSLKPGDATPLEYVVQQKFEMSFTGIFAQVLGFLDRLEKLRRIVRVDDFSMKPKSGGDQKYVELEGVVQLNTYRYIGTKADEIAKGGESANGKASPEAGDPRSAGSARAAPRDGASEPDSSANSATPSGGEP